MKYRFVITCATIILACLTACAAPQSETTGGSPVLAETTDVEATFTLEASLPESTATPQATATALPLPSPTPLPYSDLQIVYFGVSSTAATVEDQGAFLMFPFKDILPQFLHALPGVSSWLPLMAFSPDGEWVVLAPNSPVEDEFAQSKQLLLLSSDGTQAQELVALAPDIFVTAVEWSPDGQWIMLQYYYFGSDFDQIDLIHVVDGRSYTLNPAVFTGWLPDSSAMVYQQKDDVQQFNLQTMQSSLYIDVPIDRLYQASGTWWTVIKIFPQHDFLLMQSESGLVLIPGLSTLTSPASWDVEKVLESAIPMGMVAGEPNYRQEMKSAVLIPEQNLLLLSGIPYEGRDYTHVYSYAPDANEFEPYVLYDLLGLEWLAREEGLLALRRVSVPYQGSFNHSGVVYRLDFVVQPLDGKQPTVLFSVEPECGLFPQSTTDEAPFSSRRLMDSCMQGMNMIDVFIPAK